VQHPMNLFRRLGRRAAPVVERRLHKRAVLYWSRAADERGLLHLRDLDATALEDWLTHGFLLDLTDSAAPRIVRVGPVLQEEAGIGGGPVNLADVDPNSLLARFAAHHPRVLYAHAPVMAEYDFVTDAGYRVLCRGALLPVSAGGDAIDHVYGVVSWKSEKVAAAA
jgi:hypothetical protein